jgi:hypothetical protein
VPAAVLLALARWVSLPGDHYEMTVLLGWLGWDWAALRSDDLIALGSAGDELGRIVDTQAMAPNEYEVNNVATADVILVVSPLSDDVSGSLGAGGISTRGPSQSGVNAPQRTEPGRDSHWERGVCADAVARIEPRYAPWWSDPSAGTQGGNDPACEGGLANGARVAQRDARVASRLRGADPAGAGRDGSTRAGGRAASTGGRQRSASEFRSLYEAAGFELVRIVPTLARVSVIEGVRV